MSGFSCSEAKTIATTSSWPERIRNGPAWVGTDTEYDRNFADQWTPQAMRYAQRVPALGIPSAAKGVVYLHDA